MASMSIDPARLSVWIFDKTYQCWPTPSLYCDRLHKLFKEILYAKWHFHLYAIDFPIRVHEVALPSFACEEKNTFNSQWRRGKEHPQVFGFSSLIKSIDMRILCFPDANDKLADKSQLIAYISICRDKTQKENNTKL